MSRVKQLEAEIRMLRHKLSPLQNPEFTEAVADRLALTNLSSYNRKFRGGEYVTVTLGEMWRALWPEVVPDRRSLTNLGRSLQALLWERSALHGEVVFVMPLEEYHEQYPNFRPS